MISGYSDDIVCIEGSDGFAEEYDAYKGACFLVKDLYDTEIMHIHSLYDKMGCWSFSVSMIDEDTPIPDIIEGVSVILKTERSYSTGLCIESSEKLDFVYI